MFKLSSFSHRGNYGSGNGCSSKHNIDKNSDNQSYNSDKNSNSNSDSDNPNDLSNTNMKSSNNSNNINNNNISLNHQFFRKSSFPLFASDVAEEDHDEVIVVGQSQPQPETKEQGRRRSLAKRTSLLLSQLASELDHGNNKKKNSGSSGGGGSSYNNNGNSISDLPFSQIHIPSWGSRRGSSNSSILVTGNHSHSHRLAMGGRGGARGGGGGSNASHLTYLSSVSDITLDSSLLASASSLHPGNVSVTNGNCNGNGNSNSDFSGNQGFNYHFNDASISSLNLGFLSISDFNVDIDVVSEEIEEEENEGENEGTHEENGEGDSESKRESESESTKLTFSSIASLERFLLHANRDSLDLHVRRGVPTCQDSHSTLDSEDFVRHGKRDSNELRCRRALGKLPSSSSSSSATTSSARNDSSGGGKSGVVTHQEFLENLRQRMGSEAFLVDGWDSDEEDVTARECDDGTLHTVPMAPDSMPGVVDNTLEELYARQKSMGTRRTEESSCCS
ncbi:hypothetical protein ACHAXS_006607 [Conticribra weissflogii]